MSNFWPMHYCTRCKEHHFFVKNACHKCGLNKYYMDKEKELLDRKKEGSSE